MGFISTEMGLAERVLAVLGLKASSWSHISLSMDEDTIYLLWPYRNMFTGLQKINLVIDDDYPDRSLELFQVAPALKTLSTRGVFEDDDCLCIPWRQLTRYMARDSESLYATNSSHFEILPRLENLQICWLDCVALGQEASGPTSPILLPTQDTLTLSCTNPDDEDNREWPNQLLTHVTLPALRVLRFRNGCFGIVTPLLRLVERSRCSLRDFTLCNLDSSGSNDNEVLVLMKSEALKAVETLWIGWGSEDDGPLGWTEGYKPELSRLLHALVTTETSEGLLPSLRCLQTNNWDLDMLAAIVDSRHSRIGGCRQAVLDHLVLRDHREWTPAEAQERRAESKERLQVLIEKGLRLEWRGPDLPEV
ncbi:hypothetical protein PM082_014337 [Marasmius tenuissimus]|nr:hypothetical protein PM082_014337 [Marasmius tenuissimus]